MKYRSPPVEVKLRKNLDNCAESSPELSVCLSCLGFDWSRRRYWHCNGVRCSPAFLVLFSDLITSSLPFFLLALTHWLLTVNWSIFNKVQIAGYCSAALPDLTVVMWCDVMWCDVRNYLTTISRLLRGFDWKENILMRTRSEIWAGKEARKGKTWWEWEAGNWESFTQIITYLSPDWRGTKTPACSRLLQAASELFGWRRAFRNNEEFHWPPRQTGCYHQAAE